MCYAGDAKKVEADMRSWYDLKVRAVMGDDDDDDKEVTILNRTLRLTDGGLEYAADPRHEGRSTASAWTRRGWMRRRSRKT